MTSPDCPTFMSTSLIQCTSSLMPNVSFLAKVQGALWLQEVLDIPEKRMRMCVPVLSLSQALGTQERTLSYVACLCKQREHSAFCG